MWERGFERRCSARERNCSQNFEDAPQGSAILNEKEIMRIVRAGARFSSKFSGCSAWECDFCQNFQDAQFFSEFSGCSAREDNCLQNSDEEDELQQV